MRYRWCITLGALVTALLLIAACTSRPKSSWLMLGGDVMLARGGEPIFNSFSPWGDIAQYFSEKETGLFAVNLESTLGEIDRLLDPNQLSMNLCAVEDSVSVLQQAGVDLVTTGNNHTDDCIASDTIQTKTTLEKAGIQALDDSQGVLLVPVGEQIVAFANINAYSGGYDPEMVLDDLSSARYQSDLVVVSIHWGNEYQAGPSQAQEHLAQELIDAGADLVWGHHPHVLQRMEWMTSVKDGHRGLVMYSLGNLLSDQWMLPDALRTALIQIEFSDHKIKTIGIIPVKMDVGTATLGYAEEAELHTIVNRLQVDKLCEGETYTVIRVEGND